MTIQTIFNRMMLHDNQLDLVSGGDDVARGLVAVNLVQDWWEMVAAGIPRLCQTYDTLLTVTDQEHTVRPTGLKRIDALWMLASTGRQAFKLDTIDMDGAQSGGGLSTLLDLVVGGGPTGAGQPREYYDGGRGGRILWSPIPDAVYTLRAYGLWEVADYTAAGDTFGYPDEVALAMVPFATKLFRVGLDRDTEKTQSMAEAAFRQAAKNMRPTRTEPQSRVYGDAHDT